MKYNLDKYNLPPETASEIENQVFTMLATGTNYPFDDTTYEDFASSVHNLADLSIPLGQEAVAVRSEVLREELAKLGISTPDGDFVYFGGRCVPTPTMFIAKETRPEVADKMAEDIISKMFTEDVSDNETVVSALLQSAAMDDVLLNMRTQALVKKLNEKHPEMGIKRVFGNFTILPDGSLLSLHYLYDREPDWPSADNDVAEA